MNIPQKLLVVICGPTATGKTALAEELAAELNCDILSADSRQFFKELSIGTAKPGNDSLQRFKYHFINNISIHDDYSAGQYERDALALLQKIYINKNVALLVGGSGLYLNAVCLGLDDRPAGSWEQRKEMQLLFENKGIEALQSLIDKELLQSLNESDRMNPQRLMRLIERQGEQPQSPNTEKQRKENDLIRAQFTILKIGVTLPREELYERINQRVDQMIKDGLPAEAREVYTFAKKLNSLQTVGYKELFDHFGGKYSLEEAVKLIKQHTRNFAKRQVTWFGKDKDIQWLGPHDGKKALTLIKERLTFDAG